MWQNLQKRQRQNIGKLIFSSFALVPTTHKMTSQRPIITSWKYPPLGNFKLNFDDSIRGSSTTTGVLIKNHKGNLVLAKAFNLGDTPVMIAKAMSLKNGILLSLQHNIFRIIIECDNRLVIETVQNKWKIPWKMQFLIRDIQ